MSTVLPSLVLVAVTVGATSSETQLQCPNTPCQMALMHRPYDSTAFCKDFEYWEGHHKHEYEQNGQNTCKKPNHPSYVDSCFMPKDWEPKILHACACLKREFHPKPPAITTSCTKSKSSTSNHNTSTKTSLSSNSKITFTLSSPTSKNTIKSSSTSTSKFSTKILPSTSQSVICKMSTSCTSTSKAGTMSSPTLIIHSSSSMLTSPTSSHSSTTYTTSSHTSTGRTSSSQSFSTQGSLSQTSITRVSSSQTSTSQTSTSQTSTSQTSTSQTSISQTLISQISTSQISNSQTSSSQTSITEFTDASVKTKITVSISATSASSEASGIQGISSNGEASTSYKAISDASTAGLTSTGDASVTSYSITLGTEAVATSGYASTSEASVTSYDIILEAGTTSAPSSTLTGGTSTTASLSSAISTTVSCITYPTCVKSSCLTDSECCAGAFCGGFQSKRSSGVLQRRTRTGQCLPDASRFNYCTSITASSALGTGTSSDGVTSETGTSVSSTASHSVEESLTTSTTYSIPDVTGTPSVSISVGEVSTSTVASDVSSPYASTTSTSTPTLVPAVRLGCYSEPEGHRALTGAQEFYGQGFLTDVESCQAACTGFTYFGVEYGEECYCGDEVSEGSYKQLGDTPDETGCNIPCLNTPDEYCGGDGLFDLYHMGLVPVPISMTTTTDAVASSTSAFSIGSATSTSCIPYPTEEGQPCQSNEDCGDYGVCPLKKHRRRVGGPSGHCVVNTDKFTFCPIPTPSASALTSFMSQIPSITDSSDVFSTGSATSSSCIPYPTVGGQPCQSQEDCGEYAFCPLQKRRRGLGVINGYCVVGADNSLFCTTPTPSPSPSPSITFVSPTPSMTDPPAISSTGGAAPLNTAEVTSAQATTTSAVCAPEPTCVDNNCNDDAECCDGAVCDISSQLPRRGLHRRNIGSCVVNTRLDFCTTTLSLAGATDVSSSTIGTDQGISAASTITSSTGTPSPTTVTSLAAHMYLGCFSEASGTRALSDSQQFYGEGERTDVESCSEACSDYTYFGVEFGAECYCGNTINLGSVPQLGSTPDETGCNKACAHNGGEYCGGGNRLNLYMKYSPEPTQGVSATVIAGATMTTDAVFTTAG